MMPLLQNYRYSIVLAALAILFLAAAAVETSENVVGLNLIRLALSLVTISAFFVSTGTTVHRLVVGCAVLVWLATSWVPVDATGALANDLAATVAIIVLVYMSVVLTRAALRAERITLDIVNGGIAAYLLLALAWAASYQLADRIAPGSFSVALGDDFESALYFSLTTITTLGYGDIVPVSQVARIWATLEAASGLFFVAVMIARLVADFRRVP